MATFSDLQQSTERLRQRMDAADQSRNLTAQEDVVIDTPRRLMVRSPNGTHWSVSVDDTGKLFTVNLGPNPL